MWCPEQNEGRGALFSSMDAANGGLRINSTHTEINCDQTAMSYPLYHLSRLRLGGIFELLLLLLRGCSRSRMYV
jgi:hypothetical protein